MQTFSLAIIMKSNVVCKHHIFVHTCFEGSLMQIWSSHTDSSSHQTDHFTSKSLRKWDCLLGPERREGRNKSGKENLMFFLLFFFFFLSQHKWAVQGKHKLRRGSSGCKMRKPFPSVTRLLSDTPTFASLDKLSLTCSLFSWWNFLLSLKRRFAWGLYA